MKKIDSAVMRETKFIALFCFVMSVLMQAVFLIIGKWDSTVLFGNVLSFIFSVLNFFLMGITVQKAVLTDEIEAKNIMRISQVYRNILTIIVLVIGISLPVFNTWSVIVPIFFPRISIALRQIIKTSE